jgi:methylenetetrahydrofolate dehydrogenase (NADP+)/methenyltetrahydrofolate cyclohydrolase
MMARILYGADIKAKKVEALQSRIAALREKGKTTLRLVSIQVGHDDNSRVYLNAQRKNAELLGIEYVIRHFETATTKEILIFNIRKLNDDPSVDAIIIQTPLPAHIDYHAVIQHVAVKKDGEGTHPFNIGRLFLGYDELCPPTAKAALEIIEDSGIDLYGKEAVIVGHSGIVGKPLALMLMNRHATVSVAHKATFEKGQLAEYTRRADLLIVAVGRAEMIRGDMVKDGAVVVDVGINSREGKIVGDVAFDDVKEKVSAISPVPGGVGPVTAIALMENVVYLAEHAHDE